MKKKLFQTKPTLEEWHCFNLMFGLREQLDSLSSYVFNLQQYVVLVEIYQRKSRLTQIYAWEREEYF